MALAYWIRESQQKMDRMHRLILTIVIWFAQGTTGLQK